MLHKLSNDVRTFLMLVNCCHVTSFHTTNQAIGVELTCYKLFDQLVILFFPRTTFFLLRQDGGGEDDN